MRLTELQNIQQSSHEMRLKLVTGRVVHFTMRELHGIYREPSIMFMVAVSVVLIALMDPAFFPGMPSPISRAMHWGVAGLLYVATAPRWVGLCYWVWQSFSQRPIPHVVCNISGNALCHLLASIPTFAINGFVPEPATGLTLLGFFNICVIVCTIETAGAMWLLPIFQFKYQMQTEQAKSRTEPSTEDRVVTLCGEAIPLITLQRVRSMEHYLVLTQSGTEHLVRARMVDFLAQLDTSDGIQTHRSHWVSTAEALAIKGGNLATVSGDEIPIARGRLKAVKDWLNEGHQANSGKTDAGEGMAAKEA